METCMLCNSSEKDELKFGELISNEGVVVHYFCLLFGPALFTRGTDLEGVRGFLTSDILAECKRVKQLVCFYCKKRNANLGCCVKKCKRTYHFKCGLENNVSFEFIERYPSYCQLHTKYVQKQKPKIRDACGICMEKVKRLEKPILIPCCKNSWFHRNCLQKYAITAGSFFKCPMCNDKDCCHPELKRLGIFIPEKDADWELDDIVFEELNNVLEKTCDSDNCFNTSISILESPWLWKICYVCGFRAIHEACHNAEAPEDTEFTCKSCTVDLKNLDRPENKADEKLDISIGSSSEIDKENRSAIVPKNNIILEHDESSSEDEFLTKFLPQKPKKKLTAISWFSDEEQFSDVEDYLSERKPNSWKCKSPIYDPGSLPSASNKRRRASEPTPKTKVKRSKGFL